MTVYGGTPKISMGRHGDTDYRAKLSSARAEADGNPYVRGGKSVLEDGPGVSLQETRGQ